MVFDHDPREWSMTMLLDHCRQTMSGWTAPSFGHQASETRHVQNKARNKNAPSLLGQRIKSWCVSAFYEILPLSNTSWTSWPLATGHLYTTWFEAKMQRTFRLQARQSVTKNVSKNTFPLKKQDQERSREHVQEHSNA